MTKYGTLKIELKIKLLQEKKRSILLDFKAGAAEGIDTYIALPVHAFSLDSI